MPALGRGAPTPSLTRARPVAPWLHCASDPDDEPDAGDDTTLIRIPKKIEVEPEADEAEPADEAEQAEDDAEAADDEAPEDED